MYVLVAARNPFPNVWDEATVNNGPCWCVVEMGSEATNGVDAVRAGSRLIHLGPDHLDKLPRAFTG